MELNKLTTQEWLEMLPCKIYDRKENKSYLIIAITKNGLYYHDTVQCLNDDDFSWSPYDTVFSPSYLHLDAITTDFELGVEPTEKQVQWLTKAKLMTKSMTKQEAWKIINEAYKTLDLTPYYTTKQINSILKEAMNLDVY
jgi:hypothetical protein